MYFHAYIKQKNSTNNISCLVDDQGRKIIDRKSIELEVLGFYKQLLGFAMPVLPAMDRGIMSAISSL